MKIFTDAEASLEPLAGKTVAILGYGNQGRAQALNLRDNGVRLIVGNRQDSYLEQARLDGFDPLPIKEAAAAGDYLFVLTTDESQPLIWEEQIAPGLAPDKVLVWASGYNVAYDLITPPADVDVIMVAPRMTGNMVRELFQQGRGAMAQVAVHQDASGHAWDRMMAVAMGIGSARVGVFESSFREEAELDLYTEQILWAGLVAWFEACFELGVELGFPPELMVFDLYASGEASEILGLMARNGFYNQMTHHSTTSQYGTLSRVAQYISEETRARMRELAVRDIKEGAFAREWSSEQAGGSETLAALKSQAFKSDMSQAEAKIIPIIQGAHNPDS